MPVIVEFVARETQDFASLQAAAIVMPIPKPSSCKSIYAKSCVSTGRKCIYCQRYHRMCMWDGRDGRRNILRLYWAAAIERIMREWQLRGEYRDA